MECNIKLKFKIFNLTLLMKNVQISDSQLNKHCYCWLQSVFAAKSCFGHSFNDKRFLFPAKHFWCV